MIIVPILVATATIAITGIVVFVLIRQRSLRSRAKQNGIPTLDGAWPLLGNIPALWMRSSTEVHRQVADFSLKHRRDGVVRLEILHLEGYILTRPDTIKSMLISPNHNKASLYRAFHNWLGVESMALTPVHKWTPVRKLVNDAFKAQSLESYRGDFNRAAQFFCDHLVVDMDHQVDDLNACMFVVANDVLYATSFGFENPYSIEQKFEKAKLVQGLFDMFSARYTNPLYQIDKFYHQTAAGKRWLASIGTIKRHSEEAVKKAKQRLEGGAVEKPDIITPLLRNGFPKDVILHQANTFQSAGTDTVADGLTWMVLYTAAHTDVQEKLITLIDEELSDVKITDEIPSERVKKIKLVDYVMRESLRIRTPCSLMGRKLIDNLELDDGKKIPAGAECFFNSHAVHFDDEVYEKPDEFRPERWHNSTISNMAFLPFSEGRRICVGWRHAEETMRFTLVHILLRYRMETDIDPDKVPFKYHGTLHPMTPIPIRFIPRERPAV